MKLLKSWFALSAFIAGLAILSASPAWAQLYGSLTGVITHPSGTVIPGATATATVTISLTLPLATTRRSVEVISQAAQLGTQDAATGQVIDRKFINDLPNVGRDVISLAYLTPSVVSSQNGGQTGGQGNNLWRLQ
jgi:hypothetical protein